MAAIKKTANDGEEEGVKEILCTAGEKVSSCATVEIVTESP